MRRIVLTTFIAVSAAAFPAAAQTRDQQWEWCGDASDQDRAIASCTSLIESGQETLEKLALAYSNRGYFLSNKHQYDRAISDLDQAIRTRSAKCRYTGQSGACLHRGRAI